MCQTHRRPPGPISLHMWVESAGHWPLLRSYGQTLLQIAGTVGGARLAQELGGWSLDPGLATYLLVILRQITEAF